MGLTSAMYTGLSGLNANQFRIDTIGNNIANVNTTAFKSSRASFQNQFSIMLSGGSAPSDTSGGSNPAQVGMGAALGSIQRNQLGGALETTGVPTDMAIEGNGFFIVRTPELRQAFTRDGMFALDAANTLVTADGFPVQGYLADADFNIDRSQLQDINIPLGTMTIARATAQATFDGNLNANGTTATQGTILNSQALVSAPGVPATAATLLTSLADAVAPGVPLFAAGDVITLQDVRKGSEGGRQIPEATFTVDPASTLGDFLTFLSNEIGINPDPALSNTPGITVASGLGTPPDGTIIIEGNVGAENAISIGQVGIRSSGAVVNPFSLTETQAANGESVYTSFLAFDSLGTPVQVNVTAVLEDKTDGGTTWRFYAESPQDTDATPVLGTTGTIQFDTNGQLLDSTNNAIQIDRTNSGASTPVNFTLDFANLTGLTTSTSTMVMTLQDGFEAGTLTSFNTGEDGIINGIFSNGLTRPLGQIALATFINPEGLLAQTNNLYFVGSNSGQPLITPPSTMGAGRIQGATLELSNVDLTREFIGLVTASTGFSASGRVINTSNQLLNELLSIAR
jgi:flagellar hook protein FlgE